MPRLTIDDLKKIKEKHRADFTLREGGYRAKVTVHMGTCGIAAGARAVMSALMDEISKSKRNRRHRDYLGLRGTLCERTPCNGRVDEPPAGEILRPH